MGTVQRQSLSLTIISYAGALLGMVNKVFLLTNFLDASQVGLINVLTTVAILYAQFSALGMVSVGIRFFPYFENRGKKHNGFLFWGNVVILVGFMVTSIVFMLFKPFIVKDYSESPLLAEYYNYLIPFAFAVVYFQFFDTYLRALIKTTIATFINEILGRVAVTVCIALYAFKWIDFHQFVILYVVGNCSLTLVLMAYMWYLKQLHIMPASGKMFKRLFKAIALYGIFTILSSLGSALIKSIDTIMVTGMLNLAKAGIYTTIFYFPTVISLPFRSLQRTTYPLIARYWKKRDMVSMYDLYQKTTLVTMIIGGVLTLGIWANLDFIFSFMPKEYADGKYVFLFLAISVYVDMITGLNGIILVTSKKYKYDLWFLLLLIGVTVIMNLIFIPIYGITGAAIAAAASVIINNIARVLFVQYFFKMQPFTINCLWILLITAAAWVISIFIPQTGNKYVNVVMNSAIIGLAYAIPVLLLKLSPDVNKLAYGITKFKFLKPADTNPTS